VKEVDKQAIAYVNTLQGRTYSSSPEIQQRIYGLYLKQEFQYLDGDIYISRSKLMTTICDPANPNYDGHGIVLSDDYDLLKTFMDNGVAVSIYGRQ
jgi:hypothetical protein